MPSPLDVRLADCFAQARDLADDGVIEQDVAYALLRRAYGVGYLDAVQEHPDTVGAREALLRAWTTTEVACRALAVVVARRVAAGRRPE